MNPKLLNKVLKIISNQFFTKSYGSIATYEIYNEYTFFGSYHKNTSLPMDTIHKSINELYDNYYGNTRSSFMELIIYKKTGIKLNDEQLLSLKPYVVELTLAYMKSINIIP